MCTILVFVFVLRRRSVQQLTKEYRKRWAEFEAEQEKEYDSEVRSGFFFFFDVCPHSGDHSIIQRIR
jgi:hypothetical protein